MARRPSPVAVMAAQKRSPPTVTSSPKDDPMDLGPFLNEYVLNNPFTPAASPLPARPVTALKLQQGASMASPPRMRTAPRVSGSPPAASSVPVLAVKAIPSPVVHQVAPIVHQAAPPGAGLVRTHLAGLRVPLMALGAPLTVVDTPKAHIGSNHNFAIMLRENKLPHKHIKVKKWLIANYRHVPTSAVWLLSDNLLDHAHELFSDLKGSVMSRIMKVTFPHCHKVTNKFGYFYIGLIPRPRKQHYGDELLRMAAEAIATGQMTSDMASQVHGVSSDLLNRMVVWFDTLNDPVPEDKPLEVDSDPDWVLSDTDSESDEVDVEASVQHSPRNNLKWKLREKARCRLLTKMKRSGGRDSSPDWQPHAAARPRPYTPRRASSRLSGRTGGAATARVKREAGSESEDGDDDTRMDCEDASSEASLPLQAASPTLPVMAAIGSVQSVTVKDEPVDTGYACYERNNNDNDSSPITTSPEQAARAPFHTLRHLLTEKLERVPPGDVSNNQLARVVTNPARVDRAHSPVHIPGHSPGHSPGNSPKKTQANIGNAGKSSQSLSSVVDLLTVKQELQQTREDLTDKRHENSDLERKLGSAHMEIEQLQKTVSSQETQLFDLASEFFELSNRFMKMTHKFKQALTDAKAKRT